MKLLNGMSKSRWFLVLMHVLITSPKRKIGLPGHCFLSLMKLLNISLIFIIRFFDTLIKGEGKCTSFKMLSHVMDTST